MKIRPSVVYRNALYGTAACIILYTMYCIFCYEDSNHERAHRRQKHLFLTVAKDRMDNRFGVLSPKRILLWTPIFRSFPDQSALSDCKGFSDRCILLSDAELVDKADAVLFHGQDITSRPYPNPNTRKSTQRYVFMSMETPDNSGAHGAAEIKSMPKNYFNWTMTYSSASDVVWKYGPYWLPTKEAETKGFRIESFHMDSKLLEKKKNGIFALISNCNTKSKREQAIDELKKHISVTVAGKCGDKELCPMGKSCQDIFEQFPFYIAIENTNCNDYITEKYWARIKFASIPIVSKRSYYEAINAPPHSFIAMDDYKNAAEMTTHLKYLESNRTAYSEYFDWRKGIWTLAPWNAPGYRNGWCRLCERLWEENSTENVIYDVYRKFSEQTKCEGGEVVDKWLASV